MSNYSNKIIIVFFSVVSILIVFPLISSASESSPETNAAHLLKGKKSLDAYQYQDAVKYLTTAYEQLPLLGDYALLWRARAYEGKDETDNALADLRLIKDRYKDSPLLKQARTMEIELLKKKNDTDIGRAFESFVKDYPSEYAIKLAYAAYLKENKNADTAKKIFREIFASASSLSKNALNELSSSDITAEDFLKKGNNLSKAWLFGEAEKYFREALKKDRGQYKDEILAGLGYSLFGQKRYKEAAELYRETNSTYWQARSLLRTKDMEAFDSKLSAFTEINDKRIAAVLIAYSAIKRRDGEVEKALKILNDVITKYPSEKEAAMWAIGWTYYISHEYKKAEEIFAKLNDSHDESKYAYWKNKASGMSGESKPSKVLFKKRSRNKDYYVYLSMLKEEEKLPAVEDGSFKVSLSSLYAERINILTDLGLKQEAVSELLYLSKKNLDQNTLVYISSNLKKLGNYKMSVNLDSKLSYNEELHDLFYPVVFRSEIDEASRKNSIDPFLILAVMREESRFDPEARSMAGALGLMQLMPQTAHRYTHHVKISLKSSEDLYTARTNIMIGSAYLKHLLKTYNSIPTALAAYNAGEDAVKEWLKKGNYNTIDEFIEDIPYDETRNYVKKVLTSYFEYIRTGKDFDVPATKKYIGNL